MGYRNNKNHGEYRFEALSEAEGYRLVSLGGQIVRLSKGDRQGLHALAKELRVSTTLDTGLTDDGNPTVILFTESDRKGKRTGSLEERALRIAERFFPGQMEIVIPETS